MIKTYAKMGKHTIKVYPDYYEEEEAYEVACEKFKELGFNINITKYMIEITW